MIRLRRAKARIKELWNKLRNVWLRRYFAHLDLTAEVSPKAKFRGRENISIGANAMIFDDAQIFCVTGDGKRTSANISIGENSMVFPFAYLHTYVGDIVVGNDCTINPYVVLYGHGGLKIGNGVRIASHTVIVPGNHNFDRLDVPIWQQGSTLLGVQIDDDVWIGAGVRILDGVHIATGCVIGAGSVVTQSTEPYGIYAGVPAKLIRKRGEKFWKTS